MPELSDAFGMSAAAVASLVGLFYYGYSPFSLVAGVAMDRLGPRRVVPIGAAARRRRRVAVRDRQPRRWPASGGFLQGAGGVFALVGAAYIATTNFPASRAATLIGATQMFGMAGGSAGQFLVGPLIAVRRAVEHVLGGHGHRGPGDQRRPAHVLLPEQAPAARRDNWLKEAARIDRAGLPEPAVDPVRHDRRPDVHPDHDLRHGLGRPLSCRRRTASTTRGRAALGHGAVRMDHRLSAARLRVGPDRPAQAGDRRQRSGAARCVWRGSSTARRGSSRHTCWAS